MHRICHSSTPKHAPFYPSTSGAYNRRPCTAQNFEEAKRAMGGFHFVAVQSEADADDVAGFWLLKEVKM